MYAIFYKIKNITRMLFILLKDHLHYYCNIIYYIYTLFKKTKQIPLTWFMNVIKLYIKRKKITPFFLLLK